MQASNIRKRPVKVTLNRKLWEEARDLGINISEAGERGLRAAVEKAQADIERNQSIVG